MVILVLFKGFNFDIGVMNFYNFVEDIMNIIIMYENFLKCMGVEKNIFENVFVFCILVMLMRY